MSKRTKIVWTLAGVLAVSAAALLILGGSIFKPAAKNTDDPQGYTTAKVTRGDIQVIVPGSGQFEPNTIAIVRPDSNMPTRKVVRIMVGAGQTVKANQPLVEIDASGLDLDLQGAQATYDAQKIKLANLKARPADLEKIQAEAGLTQARSALESQQQNYNTVKALADKQLASRNQLAEAERQLAVAKAQAEASQRNYDNARSQSQVDVIRAQEAQLAQADSGLRKAQLVWDSHLIRSPIDGMVAELNVNVGDMVGPSGVQQTNSTGDKYGASTAIMTVVQPNPMILVAQVNETDMGLLKIGNKAVVTPTAYPDLHLNGTVTQIDLHATVQSNVSVFNATIEVPNPDGKILWGMNADADITVLMERNILTLPSAAVRTVGGESQVTILDEGKPVAWTVQTGAGDDSRIQIVAGLDEGQEVLVQGRKTTSTSGGRPQGQQGMGQVFRVMH